MTDFAAKARIRRVSALEKLQVRRQTQPVADGNLADQVNRLMDEAEYRTSQSNAQVFAIAG